MLETARGGILLRGLGYESNDVSVLTNISADHLDLQGIHTLPELAEVKSVICRVTRPAAPSSSMPTIRWSPRSLDASARRCFFSLKRRAVARGTPRRPWRNRVRAPRRCDSSSGLAHDPSRAGGRSPTCPPRSPASRATTSPTRSAPSRPRARSASASPAQIAGLRDVRLLPDALPGRLNLYLRGNRLVIVDYAHNEAGVRALFDTAEGLVGPRGKRRATLSLIVGTAGDRPDDAIRAVGRLAAERAEGSPSRRTCHSCVAGRARAPSAS